MKIVFFKWLWLALLIFTGLGYGYNLGFFHKIYQYDISHLTLIIYLIFFCITAKIGWFAWKIDRLNNIEKETNNFVEMIQIWATRAQYVGVIGTSAGVAIAFSNMNQVDALVKVGTSIYNILVSMSVFLILEIQCRHVEVNIRKEYLNEKNK